MQSRLQITMLCLLAGSLCSTNLLEARRQRSTTHKKEKKSRLDDGRRRRRSLGGFFGGAGSGALIGGLAGGGKGAGIGAAVGAGVGLTAAAVRDRRARRYYEEEAPAHVTQETIVEDYPETTEYVGEQSVTSYQEPTVGEEAEETAMMYEQEQPATAAPSIQDLQAQLNDLRTQQQQLMQENARLRALLGE